MKNEISDYLAQNAIDEADRYAKDKPWTRVIWDVTAVVWLLNDGGRFMLERIIKTPKVTYWGIYEDDPSGNDMNYVYCIHRDSLMQDLISKMTAFK